MNAEQKDLLKLFSERLKSPAVGAGLLDSDGALDFEVSGVCQRGGQVPVQPGDQWHIGSCTKSLSAVLFARLVELGLADWHSSVASLFPDLQGRISPVWQSRSIEQLFHCEAGLRANPSLRAMRRSHADTRSLVEQRSDCALAALSKEPKASGRFVYSNLSYIVIGAAIDRIGGSSYEAAMGKYVLQPLGIHSAGYGAPPTICGHKSVLRLGNVLLFKGGAVPADSPRADNPAVFSSAGTLHLNLQDWASFLRLFVGGGAGLLRAASIDYLLKRSPLSVGGMAKGWIEANEIPEASFLMQGSNTLWSATAMMDAHRRRMAVVVCNDGRTLALMASVVLAAELLASVRD